MMGWNYKAFLCYNLPKKHKDCDMRYISGWEALNVPNEQGVTADWHSSAYFHNLQPNKIYDYNANNPLKMLGIKKKIYRISWERILRSVICKGDC